MIGNRKPVDGEILIIWIGVGASGDETIFYLCV